MLQARGINIDDVQRYTLLREVASGLAFLHKHGVCVGDISPKNLLFSLTPQEAVYFIDCDAVRINGVSALQQMETPGWEAPAGEELATIYSDAYKLGLLALRLLAGDQDTANLQHLPSTTPASARQIITDTLTNAPQRRPLPEAWTYVLGGAIEQAQYRQKTSAAAPISVGSRILHPIPVVPLPAIEPSVSATAAIAAADPAFPPAGRRFGASTEPTGLFVQNLGRRRPGRRRYRRGSCDHRGPGHAQQPHRAHVERTSGRHRTTDAASAALASDCTAAHPEAADPIQQLQAFKNQDAPAIAQVVGQWIPQLSSKHGEEPWTYDPEDNVTYEPAQILQEHQQLRQQYGAKLLWSGDWTTYDRPDYWVTVVPTTYPDSDSVLNWCRSVIGTQIIAAPKLSARLLAQMELTLMGDRG